MGGAGHLYTWVKVENGPRMKPCVRVRKLTSEHEGEKTRVNI